ncbi:MAG: aminoacetone oxidase family FAD-binding enzyme, partial [Candidatus Omnitrophica bacterium]|nr:aminoacetone oxidase family FAD-binding enzyme [Candidatus Omnitrophota bacterium]
RLQGLTVKNIRITIRYGKKKITSKISELLFTHFGVSGPVILDLSGKITPLFGKHEKIQLFIDLKPGLDFEKLERRILRDFTEAKNALLKNVMTNLIPQRLADVFIDIAGLERDKRANQVTRKERHSITNLLKALPLTLKGPLPLDKAMVTSGGVSTAEINPRTMESKIVPGLYFAGEIIDGAAPSGGYNLQQAFSTGYLAGEKV